jgi:hypothetical protein
VTKDFERQLGLTKEHFKNDVLCLSPKLQTPQYAYTVQLGTAEEGIEVTSKKEKQAKVTCKWSEALEAWRNKDCIYLFISSRQAFLLPDGQGGVSTEELWKLLSERMEPSKLHG